MSVTPEGRRILAARRRIEETFDANSWMELGLLTDCSNIIERHDRLLRSLSWGDQDYSGCVLDVLNQIVSQDPTKLKVIEDYLDHGLDEVVEGSSGVSVSGKRLSITPRVFAIPDRPPEPDLLSAMMPFDRGFDTVYAAIQSAGNANRMRVERADNIWEHSTIIQDIFTLIYRSRIVVCDFASKNPNVFYEAGIAHALGRHVIPMAQHISELPFDLQSHRTIIYQNNSEGIEGMRRRLTDRVSYLLQADAN